MANKLSLNLQQLHAECDVINGFESNSIKGGDWATDFFNSHPQGTYSGSEVSAWGNDYYGGYGGYGGYGDDWWQGYGSSSNPTAINEVVVYGGYGGSGSGMAFNSNKEFGGSNFSWKFWMDSYGQMTEDQGGYAYSAYSGGGSGTAGYSQNAVNYLEVANLAISNGLEWNNFYGVLDAARLGNLNYSAAAVVKEIFETNPGQALLNDLNAVGQFKGIAVLSAMINSPEAHDAFWTETWANRLAAEFFGPGSAIANDDINYPKYTPW